MLPQEITERLVSVAYKRFYQRYTFVLQRIKYLFKNPKMEILAILDGMKMIFSFF